MKSSSWLLLNVLGLPSIVTRRQWRDWDNISGSGSGVLFAHAEEIESPPLSPAQRSSSRSSLILPINDAEISSPADYPAPVVAARRLSFTSSISGHAFYDWHRNGTRDVVASAGVSNTVVSLFSCTDEEIINTTKTDSVGYYAFEGLPGGQYYIGATPPRYYAFSDERKGKTVESALNPDTGRSDCFDLEEGEDETVSFAMTLDIPPIDGLSPMTPEPTPAPSRTPIATFSPSTSPTPEVTLPLSKDPSASPSKSPEMDPPPPTGAPSKSPTPATSTAPVASSVPTSVPTTLAPIAASLSSQLPLHGPTKSGRLVMNIRGIDQLEDEELWCLATSNYIMSYFNTTHQTPGVFDVTVSIQVTNQASGNDNVFQHNQQQHLPGSHLEREGEGALEPKGQDNVRRRGRKRRLQETEQGSKSVQVTYNQISSYRTSDVQEYDHDYIATDPFLPQKGSEWYISVLRALSPHYEGVTAAEMVYADSPEVVPILEEQVQELPSDVDDEASSDLSVIVVLGAFGTMILLGAVLNVTLMVKEAMSQGKSSNPASNGKPPASPTVGEIM